MNKQYKYSCFLWKVRSKKLYNLIQKLNEKIFMESSVERKKPIEILKIDEGYMIDRSDRGKDIFEIVLLCSEDEADYMQKMLFPKTWKNAYHGFYKRPDTYNPTTIHERSRNMHKGVSYI